MENKLQVIVNESGLEKAKQDYILENFKDCESLAQEWEKKAKEIVVTDESQKDQMELAGIGRKELAKKRIAIEKSRVRMKEQCLKEGRAIDGVAKFLKELITPIEGYLKNQEKFVEIQEEKKKEEIRIEVEARIEKERLENERLDNLAIDRKSQAREYRQFWTQDDYDFRGMSQDLFEIMMRDFKNKKIACEAKQEEIRKENEKLKQEAEEKEHQRRKEDEERLRKENEQRRIQQEKERKEREAHEEELRKEREEARVKQQEIEEKARKEREEAEAKAKQEAEERARLEEQLKNQVECPNCKHKFNIK